MKYLVKSNLIILILFLVPEVIMLSVLGDTFFNLDSSYLIGLTLIEGFIFKVSLDYLNYDHDYKYFIHRLPKKLFLFLPIVLNIIAIILILLISTNFKYLLLIGLVFSNVFHILFKKNMYFIPLVVLVLFPNFLITYHGKEFFMWYGAFILASLGLAYYMKHRSFKVYTNDNY